MSKSVIEYVFLTIVVIYSFSDVIIGQTNAGRTKTRGFECRLPEHPKNGRYKVAGNAKHYDCGDDVPPYTILQYSCDEGYFVSTNVSFCKNGIWSDKPTCEKKKVVCYFPSWATYRPDKGKFDVEDIDPNLCTHLIYAFVGLSDDPGIKVRDEWNDLSEKNGRGAFGRFVKLKETNPNLKVLVAVGGWSEGSLRFSQSFNTAQKRNTFARNAVDFLLKYGFDGLDVVWEFPGHHGGAPEDKESFTDLLKSLRMAFDEHRLILSAVVAGDNYVMIGAYDIREISKYLDIINIKVYDLHGPWEPITGIRSPLFPTSDEIGTDAQGINVNSSIQSWLHYGAPAHKMVMGIGLYGRTYHVTSSCKLPKCVSSGIGDPGRWTNESGLLGYNEICILEQDPSAVRSFDNEALAPYLVKDNLWVSYDNKESIIKKVNYLLYNNLGGSSIWSLDTDDFRGDCGGGKFPLTSYIHRTVSTGIPTEAMPMPIRPERKRPIHTNMNSERALFCYYASWSVYRKDDGLFDVEDIDPNLCTHIIFAFVGIAEDFGINVKDAWNNLFDNYGKGALTRFTKLKDLNPNLLTLLAVGGYGEPSTSFSKMVGSEENRRKFVESSTAFLLKFGFDGLQIDWEFPGTRGGVPADKENFAKLLKELKEEFSKHGLLLTALVALNQADLKSTYDFTSLSNNLDFIILKTIDLHGFWDPVTGHNAPLYGIAKDNVNAGLQPWLNSGIPSNKLLMEIGTFGRTFTLTSPPCDGTGCSIKAGGSAGNFTNEVGSLGYNEICLIEKDPNSVVSKDQQAKVPFLENGDQWISYDDKQSIQHKIDYILSHNLGGAAVWTLDTDDFRGACGEGKFPLTKTLNRALVTGVYKKDFNCSETDSCSLPPSTETPIIHEITEKPSTSSRVNGCPLPEFPTGGQYSVANYHKTIVPGESVPPYTLLTYKCKKNYVPSVNITYCQEDFVWSFNPVCNRRCRMPTSYTVDFTCWDSLQNPMSCGNYVNSGTIVKYQCKHYHHSTNFYNYHMTCDDGIFDFAPPRCVPECGAEPSEGEAYVIDGESAKRGTFPWHVGIYENRGTAATVEYLQICGGTIITTHLVLSAAHCFYQSSLRKTKMPSLYAVAAGKLTRIWDEPTDNLNPYIQKSTVKNIYIPKSYGGDQQSHQSDIAILELTVPVTFSDVVHPICLNLNNDDLNRHQIRSGSLGKIAGWGLTEEEGDPSKELQFLNVPVIDYSDCRDEMDKYNFGKYLTIDKLCAGYTNGSALCKGDSGGGLVFPYRDATESVQRWYIRGIVSVGPKNNAQSSCRRDTYTAYTQVHYFKDWISRKFNELRV